MSDTLEMSVSQIFRKNGEKYAFVSFTDGKRKAEGKIPSCKIISSEGFSDEEIAHLERYMDQEIITLKNMAVGVNVIDAFMK